MLTSKKQKIKEDLEKMKHEGLEAMTRKQFDDKEADLAKAQQKHAKTKEIHDANKKMLLDLQAGIEHLCGKLNEIKLEQTNQKKKDIVNIEKINQHNLVEGLE